MGIKNLFSRPAWESKDAQIRAKAILELDAETAEQVAPQLARDDSDSQVRVQALRRVQDITLLVELCNDADAEVAKEARLKLRQLATSGSLPAAQHTLLQSVLADREHLEVLARQAHDTAIRRWALERVSRPGLLGDIALEDSDPELRLAAVARIEQSSTLRRVSKAARRSDKLVFRAASERLDAMLLAEGDRSRVAARAEELCQKLEACLRDGARDDSQAVSEIEAHWKAVAEHASAALRQRFDAALQLIRAPAQDLPTAATESAPSESPADHSSLDRQGDSAISDNTDGRNLEGSNSAPGELPEDLRKVLAQGESWLADEQMIISGKRIGQLRKRWRDLACQYDEAAVREALKAMNQRGLEALIKALEVRKEEHDQRAEQLFVDAGELLPELRNELADGHFENAKSVFGRLIAMRNQLDRHGRRFYGELLSHWNQAVSELKELRDWQHWANNKRRKALCEEIESMDVANLHPDAVAEKIRAAQAEWRAMDEHEHLPDDRRKFAAPAQLWRRFQKATQEHYKPAKAFFSKRDEVRREKRQELIALCEAMEGVNTQDANIDFVALGKLYNQARSSIRELDQIEPKYRGRTAKRLRAGLARLQPILDQQHSDVEASKEALIAEVEALAEEGDLAKATQAAKQAQRRWTELGSARRHKERALWKRFRAANDVVFGKLSESRKEADEQRQQQRQALEKIVAQAREFELPEPADAGEVRGKIRSLQQEFTDIGLRAPDLARKLDDAIDGIKAQLQQQEQAQQAQAEQGLWQVLEAVEQAEQTVLANSDAKIDLADMAASIESLLAQAEDLGQALAVRSARLRGVMNGEHGLPDETELVATAADADLLCIRLEFLAGVETPEASRQRRMDFQVSRLSATLGSGESLPQPAQEARSIVLDWCALSFVDPAHQQTLKQRFHTALAALREHTRISLTG